MTKYGFPSELVNSKLTRDQKEWHKGFLQELGELNGKVFCFPEFRTTVAMMPEFAGSRMMLVSVSIAESREKKFRCKVGEYHAIDRLLNRCEFVKVPTVFNVETDDWYNSDDAEEYQREWAENFASGLCLD